MPKHIQLSSGRQAIVDDGDYEWLLRTKWSDDSQGYAIRCKINADSTKTTEKMHRLITGAKEGEIVDHINGIPWDNRRVNLRIVTNSQNGKNKGIYPTNKTGYKGVALNNSSKGSKKYTAQITVDYRKIHLGCFDNPVEAALVYDEAARKYHGEFAKLNGDIHGWESA